MPMGLQSVSVHVGSLQLIVKAEGKRNTTYCRNKTLRQLITGALKEVPEFSPRKTHLHIAFHVVKGSQR